MIVLKELSELVQACKDVRARMTPDNHKIHVDDIAATLQKIIDDEFDRAKLTFDQVVISEAIAKDNPADPKTFCETIKVPALPRRRREQSRRAKRRIYQSQKTTKGSA